MVYKGDYFKVYFHAEGKDVSETYEYFEKCDSVTQASLLFLVKRIADKGRIYDETKFRIEDKENKIYAFKPKKERFFCFFFIENRLLLLRLIARENRSWIKKS